MKNYNTNGLEITDIIIFPVKNRIDEKIRVAAFAKVILNDMFLINGIKVLESETGAFVKYPTTPATDGRTYDVCCPITSETRNYINDQVLEQYKLTMAEYEKMND